MADVLIELTETGADIALEGGDLAQDLGLRTSLLVSLFSDARAPEGSELPSGIGTDPRGWWGDLERRRPVGSLLWVQARSKVTLESIELLRSAAADALSWLVVDDIAEAVEVTASRGGAGIVELEITITRGAASRYRHLWDATEDYDLSAEGLRVALLFR